MIKKSRKVTLRKTEDWMSKEPRVEARYHTPYTGPLGAKIVATVYRPDKSLAKVGSEAVRRVLVAGEELAAYDVEQFIVEAKLDGTWEPVETLRELRKLYQRGTPLRIDGEAVDRSGYLGGAGKLAYLLG